MDIGLMLDRNTESGVKEKAYQLTEPKIYQLHPYVKWQLYYIAKLDTAETIRGITDNFVITDTHVFEYVDCADKLFKVEFVHEIQEASYGTLGVVRKA